MADPVTGILGSILAGGVNTALSALGGFAKDIREAITGKTILDPNKQAELLLKAQEAESASVLAIMAYDKAQMDGQLAINEAEAKSGSIFNSGWRPFIGWTCGSGLLYEFLIRPILPWLVSIGGIISGKSVNIPAMPGLSLDDLIPLVLGMLGLGGMRMYEKVKGVASK